MYALISSCGRQYKVSPGDVIRMEKLDIAEGGTVTFDKVLMVSNNGEVEIGTPYIGQRSVTGKVIGCGRGKKIEVIKFKRRKRYLRRTGHRQSFTDVEITGIQS